MKNQTIKIAIAVLVFSLLLSGCGPGQFFKPTVTPSPTSTPALESTVVLSPAHFEIPLEKISTLLDDVCVVGEETPVFYSIVNTGDSEGDFEFDILFDGQLVDYEILMNYVPVDKKVHLLGHRELQDQIVYIKADLPGEHELQIGKTTFPMVCYSATGRPNNGFKILENSASGKGYFSIKNSTSVDIVVYIMKYNFVVAATYIRYGDNIRINGLEDGDYRLVYQTGSYLDPVWISELNRFAQSGTYESPFTYRIGKYSPPYTFQGFIVDIYGEWEDDPSNKRSIPEIGH